MCGPSSTVQLGSEFKVSLELVGLLAGGGDAVENKGTAKAKTELCFGSTEE